MITGSNEEAALYSVCVNTNFILLLSVVLRNVRVALF